MEPGGELPGHDRYRPPSPGYALVRPAGARLRKQNDKWAVTRRYMSLETVAGLSDDARASAGHRGCRAIRVAVSPGQGLGFDTKYVSQAAQLFRIEA